MSADDRPGKPHTAIIHYSAPPVIGGVEAVLEAQARQMLAHNYPVTVIAGRGAAEALPVGTHYVEIPLLDSQHPAILVACQVLEAGAVPENFDDLTRQLYAALAPHLADVHNTIIHNLFGKHFNLPATAALVQLIDDGRLPNPIFWGHDFTWTSPNSRHKVHPGYPWDLLRRVHPALTYVVVSERRRDELAGLFGLPPQEIQVIYNGVWPEALLGLSEEGWALVQRLDLLKQDLVLLMPVRVTTAKNIELALRVVAALKKQGCRLRLVLTGPPDPHNPDNMDYYRRLQTLRAELGVQEQMRFVYESGPEGGEGYEIDWHVVAELYRVSDMLFMPSHREGFGMPVLEAGMIGMPVAVMEAVPAAKEIGRQDVLSITPDESPEEIAERLLAWARTSRMHRLRQRVRQSYTWQALFERQLEPLLKREEKNT